MKTLHNSFTTILAFIVFILIVLFFGALNNTIKNKGDNALLEIHTTENLYYLDVHNMVLTNESDTTVIRFSNRRQMENYIEQITLEESQTN